MITSVLSISGTNLRFFLSLGITQFIDGLALGLSQSVGSAGLVIGVVLNIFITAAFAVFGFFASKKHQWAFILGMALFGLDALILLLAVDVFAILFHGLALFYIFRGFQAARELASLDQYEAMQPPPPPQPAQAL